MIVEICFASQNDVLYATKAPIINASRPAN
jgi:hypothetical protein